MKRIQSPQKEHRDLLEEINKADRTIITQFVFILATIIISVAFFKILSGIHLEETDQLKTNIKNLEKYNKNLNETLTIYRSIKLNNTNKVVGLYYDSVICLQMKDRSYIEYIETVNHEWLHYKNDKHFNKQIGGRVSGI